MFNSLFGLKVLRAIPEETIGGLLSGQYVLHGGVVRCSPGTEQAGQIVRHLIPLAAPAQMLLPLNPLPDLSFPISIHQIARTPDINAMTRQILQLSTGTMVLSGLNLAVSAIGFANLSQRLGVIEARLEAIQADVQAIRDLLERKERATFRLALSNLQNSGYIVNSDIRRSVLVDARETFGVMVEEYRELLAQAETVEAALAAEEFYCLMALARSRCSAELGELAVAHHELAADVMNWTEQVRRIVDKLLIGEHPERFLYRDTAQVAPIAAVVEWLDFASDDHKGYAWIDILRSQAGHWHADEAGGVGVWWGRSKEQERVYDRDVVVPGLVRLTARHRTLQGHGAQLALLKELNVIPSAFEQQRDKLASHAIEGYLIA
jgi:hypothetical protein